MTVATEMKPIDQGYILQRSKPESRRLDNQHSLLVDMFGYHIHPSIEQKLGPNAWIADVAAGTGIWLQDLASKYPASVQFHGFDISRDQFPDPSSLPSNISLHQQNAKEAFPSEWHGKFDLVQVRLISVGMADEDWKIVTDRSLMLLKPGGAIQWIEPDYIKPMTTQFEDGTPAVALSEGWRKACVVSGWADKQVGAILLPQIFKDAGLVDVSRQLGDSARTAELQARWSRNILDAGFQIVEGLVHKGVPGSGTLEELIAWREDAFTEFEKGARYPVNMYTIIGFKPT